MVENREGGLETEGRSVSRLGLGRERRGSLEKEEYWEHVGRGDVVLEKGVYQGQIREQEQEIGC